MKKNPFEFIMQYWAYAMLIPVLFTCIKMLSDAWDKATQGIITEVPKQNDL